MKSMLLDVQRLGLLMAAALAFVARPLLRRIRGLPPDAESLGVRLRLVLERLGLAYLKLGQFLAMRFDVLPLDVARELDKLFEGVPPMPFEAVRSVVEAELGGPLGSFFSEFNPQAVASASVAQVHAAWTRDGQKVAVKVQRAGIVPIVTADMRIFRRLAGIADWLGLAGDTSLTQVVGEFAGWMQRELDFTLDGQAADRLRRDTPPYAVVPRVDWKLSTSRVLTLEFIDGISLYRIRELLDAGQESEVAARLPDLDIEEALHHLAFALLHQLLITGFFHGDPHPGNIFVLADNSIAFVDFGITGELSKHERQLLIHHYSSLVEGDIERSARYYARLTTPTPDTDPRALIRDLKAILQEWLQTQNNPRASLQDLHWGHHSAQMLAATKRNRVGLGSHLFLYFRATSALQTNFLRYSVDFQGELVAFFLQMRFDMLQEALLETAAPQELVTVADVQVDALAALAALLPGLPEGSATLHGHRQEAPSTRRASNASARSLTGGIVALSLIIVASATHVDTVIRVWLPALPVFLFTLLTLQDRRA